MVVKRFVVELEQLPHTLPHGWEPFAIQLDPESDVTVWIWARSG